MAFSVDNLGAIKTGNSDSGRLYMYQEAQTLATLRGSGYFDAASSASLGDGDIIWLVGSDGHGMSQVVVTGIVYTLVEDITSA